MISKYAVAIALLILSAGTVIADDACNVFFDRASFEAFNANNGKFVKGIEDFEESTIGAKGRNRFRLL